MPARYAWLTFACVLCALNVSWCYAADDDEHVHIKVRMPEVVRKHKTHKLTQHYRHNYHHLPQQHHHLYHKPQHQPYPHLHYTNQAAKHGRRAVKPTPPAPKPPPSPPPPAPQLSAMMPHNQLDVGHYGDELMAGVGSAGVGSANGLRGGMFDQLLYSPNAPQPMPLAPDLAPNYGPALFGIGGGVGGNVEAGGSSVENNQQHFAGGAPPSGSMLTMPGATQQLMKHMELMGALAAAAAAAAASGGSEEVAVGEGGGVRETTNTHLADDFLADMQRTYANGKFPATNSKRKKKYRGGGLAEIGDAAAVTFPLSTPQLQQQHAQLQQQQHQQLLRQQFLQQQQKQQLRQQNQHQQFFGANYFTQQPKPQAQMLRAPTNYHSYPQHKQYKNKQHYNNNDIYSTATSDEGLGSDSGDGDDGYDNDNDDDSTQYFSSQPTTFASPHSTVAAYNGDNDYDDNMDDGEQFGYNSNSNSNKRYNNNYFDGVAGDDANEGVNPVSYQSTTGYGAYMASASTPSTVTHLKLRPYRQLRQRQQHQHQHQYTSQEPSEFSGHQQLQPPQQQQLITTAQPINVVGPTASDFDEHLPLPTNQQQHHKYPVSTRYKKLKSRIKAKANRNRIPTQ